jgi:hypothetical protein
MSVPRIPILADQSVIVADTLTRTDSSVVIVRAGEATPVFLSQQRGDLDGNLDAGGNPGGGIPIFNTDPPLILLAVKAQLWARASAKTFLYVEVMEINLEVYQAVRGASHQAQVQRRYVTHNGPLPDYEEAWIGGRRR